MSYNVLESDGFQKVGLIYMPECRIVDTFWLAVEQIYLEKVPCEKRNNATR